MKSSRRSHLAALFSALAACLGLSRRSAPASPPPRREGGSPPAANSGPKVVTSPDGRTRTFYDAAGEVVRVERFDDRGQLVTCFEFGGIVTCYAYGGGQGTFQSGEQ